MRIRIRFRNECNRYRNESAIEVFRSNLKAKIPVPDRKTLHAKIRQLTLENDFFRRYAHQGEVIERKVMIGPIHKLSSVRQCRSLDAVRSTACYLPVPLSAEELALMRRIDELHLNHPFKQTADQKQSTRLILYAPDLTVAHRITPPC